MSLSQYEVDQLEHESGLRPLGEYPDHCHACRVAARMAAKRAACEHGSVTEVSTFGGGVVARYCGDCGGSLPLDEP